MVLIEIQPEVTQVLHQKTISSIKRVCLKLSLPVAGIVVNGSTARVLIFNWLRVRELLYGKLGKRS